MSTPEQITNAHQQMRRAEEALTNYVERPEPREVDIERHKRLAADLKRCVDEYVRLVSELRM